MKNPNPSGAIKATHFVACVFDFNPASTRFPERSSPMLVEMPKGSFEHGDPELLAGAQANSGVPLKGFRWPTMGLWHPKGTHF